jgi:hypothetical protein
MRRIVYLYYVIKMRNMRNTTQKTLDYLKSNPIVNNFINQVNTQRKEYYVKSNMPTQYTEVTAEVGNKYIRLWDGTCCWGFISRVDGNLKGSLIKKGDLLKPATWKTPAKHARGNIMDGTAKYSAYGPSYL